jgi:UDP-N-acetylmuramyl pentapeptide synthase
MRNLYERSLNKDIDINIFYFTNQDKLIKKLKAYITKNDIIYIKGSRSMKMENIIKGIC